VSNNAEFRLRIDLIPAGCEHNCGFAALTRKDALKGDWELHFRHPGATDYILFSLERME
jgi:hypothetical protein